MPSTTSYKRGAVVLLPFPFSDQSASKVRPAVIAHSPYPSDDLIVVAVSSERGTLRPGECGLRYWREAGLLHPSFLKRAVASVSKDLIHRQLGVLQPADVAALELALRTWLDLPRAYPVVAARAPEVRETRSPKRNKPKRKL